MRRTLFTLPLVAMLAACNPGGGPNPQVDAVIENIRDGAKTACGFLPATNTIIGLISVFGGGTGLGAVTQVVQAICDAVNKPQARRGVTPVVRGVPIRGEYIRR